MENLTENKIAELQMIEQTAQNILMQKQTLQSQILEIDNALKELKITKEKPYKIIGTVMISTDKKELEKDLNEKKQTFLLRIKKLEKQDEQLRKNSEELQKELLKNLKK